MNPFDFYGPQFLLFYALLSILLHVLVRIYVSQQEKQYPIPKLQMSDPYQIAYLRGGENETIRIATISLIDRGLLEITNPTSKKPTLRTANAGNVDIVHRNIEKAILRLFQSTQEAHKAFDDTFCKASCSEYEKQLGQQQLVRTSEVTQKRLMPVMLVGIILGGIAIVKIMIALERGRHNILFLVILSIVSIFYLAPVVRRHRTGLGDIVLKDIKELFKPLYNRRKTLRAGGQTNEAALLAAVFGISTLPFAFSYAKAIFPKAKDSGCGTSCGTSSCGGGSGCGGGGGCGGCGS